MTTGLMKTTTVTTRVRLEFTADLIEKIVTDWLKDQRIDIGTSIEFDWDASSEGLVRGITVMGTTTTEKTE